MKRIAPIVLIALSGILFCCNHADKHNEPVKAEKVKIDNQGVNIEYDDTENGDTALLFIHGWGINKTYWTEQTAFFSKKYRVVAIDLPGFGTSGKNRKDWSVEAYGRDISAVIAALGLKHVILVGHSMSGAVVVEAVLQNPDRVIGIVGVDNFKDFGWEPTPKSKAEAEQIYQSLRTDFTENVSSYVNQALFSPSTDSVVRKRVLGDILHSDSVIAVDCLQQGDQYPLKQKTISMKKPVFLINSDFFPTDTTAFVKNNVPYYVFNIGPTGHYPMNEKPGDFNRLLEEAIAKMKD